MFQEKASFDNSNGSDLAEGLEGLTIQPDSSLYVPEGSLSTSDSSDESKPSIPKKLLQQKKKLNEFLTACDKKEVPNHRIPWERATLRTKQRYLQSGKNAVEAVLTTIAPKDAGHLWEALKESKELDAILGANPVSHGVDKKYLKALAETYDNAASWDTRRQILSIMADLAPFEAIQRFLPGLSEYRFKAARLHRIKYGRGVPLPYHRSPRMRVKPIQLDHFLDFITSPHIVQDLPFGQRELKLSSGKVIETPNIIRSMIPERIAAQYHQFCRESNFEPFSRSTMLRVLESCGATVRKSLQGLDYIAAEGAKAFDDLVDVVKKVENEGNCFGFARMCTEKIQRAKQYIKGDYKVQLGSFKV